MMDKALKDVNTTIFYNCFFWKCGFKQTENIDQSRQLLQILTQVGNFKLTMES